MNDPRHITVMENGEPNDVNLGAPIGGNGNGDPTPWGRQPGRVVVTLTGDPADTYDQFMALSRFYAGLPFDIDFQFDADGTRRILLHPWAKND